MQLVIQARGLGLTGSVRQHIERRLAFALDWARFQVIKVSVRLSDLNGPRGGEDKRCQIQLTVPGKTGVVIQDTDASLYVAIDRATSRAGRILARRLQRQRCNLR